MQDTLSLIRSFGFNIKTVKLARVIGKGIARFIDTARTTEKAKGRAADENRNAANSVFASLMQTPPRQNQASNPAKFQTTLRRMTHPPPTEFQTTRF